jgi:hypothetical protein
MKTLMKLGWGADQPTFRQIFTSLLMPAATKEQAARIVALLWWILGALLLAGAMLVGLAPDRLTQEFSKADRKGRIYVDTGRNGYSATFAAAYTVRAKRGAQVSAPCTWEEIERGEVDPGTFTLRNMPERVAKVGDVWADMRRRGRSLKRATERLGRLARR